MTNQITINTEYCKRNGWSGRTIIDLQDETREGYHILTLTTGHLG